MKRSLLLCLLGLAVISVSAENLNAQTNKSASIILPPADWDARTHVLASLVATNKAGKYTLPFTWTGVEKVTARSWHESGDEKLGTNKWFEFDEFTLSDSPSRKRLGARWISKSGQAFPQASYRRALPSDAEFLRMTNALSVSNFLGWNPFEKIPLTGAISARFFTLRPYDSIEILQVTFNKPNDKSEISSISVERGRLHPQTTTK